MVESVASTVIDVDILAKGAKVFSDIARHDPNNSKNGENNTNDPKNLLLKYAGKAPDHIKKVKGVTNAVDSIGQGDLHGAASQIASVVYDIGKETKPIMDRTKALLFKIPYLEKIIEKYGSRMAKTGTIPAIAVEKIVDSVQGYGVTMSKEEWLQNNGEKLVNQSCRPLGGTLGLVATGPVGAVAGSEILSEACAQTWNAIHGTHVTGALFVPDAIDLTKQAGNVVGNAIQMAKEMAEKQGIKISISDQPKLPAPQVAAKTPHTQTNAKG